MLVIRHGKLVFERYSGGLDRGLDCAGSRDQSCDGAGYRQRMPTTVDMHSRRNPPCLARSRADFIARHQRKQQVGKGRVAMCGQRQQGRYDRQAGAAMRRRVALARFIPTRRRRAQRGAAGGPEPDIRSGPRHIAGKGETQRAAKLLHLGVTQSSEQATESIEQQQPRLGFDIGRQRRAARQPRHRVRQGRIAFYVIR